MAVFGISGDVPYFLWVFWQRLSQTILLFFSIAFSLFYSVILESRGINDSLVLLPGYQSLFWAHHPEGWAFPCFSFFFPLILFLRKPMANFSILECACFLCHLPYGSTFGRPPSLSFFLSGRNLTLLVRKSLLLLPFL